MRQHASGEWFESAALARPPGHIGYLSVATSGQGQRRFSGSNVTARTVGSVGSLSHAVVRPAWQTERSLLVHHMRCSFRDCDSTMKERNGMIAMQKKRLSYAMPCMLCFLHVVHCTLHRAACSRDERCPPSTARDGESRVISAPPPLKREAAGKG